MHHKIHTSCIARVFYPHLHFPRSCCNQYLTLKSKSNLLGTYQNRCSSVCISFRPILFLCYFKTSILFNTIGCHLPQCSIYHHSSSIPRCLSLFRPVPFLDDTDVASYLDV